MICAKAALLAERDMESGNVAVSAEELGVFAYGGIVEQGQYPMRAVAAAQAPYAVYILIGKGIVYILCAHFIGTGKVAVARAGGWIQHGYKVQLLRSFYGTVEFSFNITVNRT